MVRMAGIELVGTSDLPRCASLGGHANRSRIVPIAGRIRLLARRLCEVPYPLVIAVPYAGLVRLVGGDRGISVEHVERGISGVRYHWDFDPKDHSTSGRVVTLPLESEGACAGGISGKNNIVTAGICNVTSIGGSRQEWIRACNEYGEVGLVCVGNLVVINRDRHFGRVGGNNAKPDAITGNTGGRYNYVPRRGSRGYG